MIIVIIATHARYMMSQTGILIPALLYWYSQDCTCNLQATNITVMVFSMDIITKRMCFRHGNQLRLLMAFKLLALSWNLARHMPVLYLLLLFIYYYYFNNTCCRGILHKSQLRRYRMMQCLSSQFPAYLLILITVINLSTVINLNTVIKLSEFWHKSSKCSNSEHK